jgi:biofilm PGA synthesis N-glycosyltransferase PgaC
MLYNVQEALRKGYVYAYVLMTLRGRDYSITGRRVTISGSMSEVYENEIPLVTVIVPAYNEEYSIDQTLLSLKSQTIPIKIIVVDDFSSDHTGDRARSFDDVTVIRPPRNTGSKAGAQNFALHFIDTEYTIALDADTSVTEDAIEKMVKFMESHPETAAACSFVIPKKVKTIWERGRFIEYMFAFSYYKRIQEWYGKPLISSGCFSIYKTKELRSIGGWSTRTLAEDMDLTWNLYENKKIVRFNHDAICYPFEPESFSMMSKQLKRWSHGWVQNLRLHWKNVKKIPVLREAIIVSVSDALFGGLMYLVIMPLAAIIFHSSEIIAAILLGDILLIALPPIIKGYKLKMVRQVLLSLPSFLVLRVVNTYFIYGAFILEYFFNKTLTKYEKGH